MQMPDFDTWGLAVQCNSHGLLSENIAEALRAAFEQGYHLGLNKGWALEQDKDNAKRD